MALVTKIWHQAICHIRAVLLIEVHLQNKSEGAFRNLLLKKKPKA
jgi:hypothetical protein